MASVSIFLNRLVWGPTLVGLMLGVGLFLTVRTGFVQITLFPEETVCKSVSATQETE